MASLPTINPLISGLATGSKYFIFMFCLNISEYITQQIFQTKDNHEGREFFISLFYQRQSFF